MLDETEYRRIQKVARRRGLTLAAWVRRALRAAYRKRVTRDWRASDMVLGSPGISARDALHLAVMERQGADTIMSFDRGFDGFPGITRIG